MKGIRTEGGKQKPLYLTGVGRDLATAALTQAARRAQQPASTLCTNKALWKNLIVQGNIGNRRWRRKLNGRGPQLRRLRRACPMNVGMALAASENTASAPRGRVIERLTGKQTFPVYLKGSAKRDLVRGIRGSKRNEIPYFGQRDEQSRQIRQVPGGIPHGRILRHLSGIRNRERGRKGTLEDDEDKLKHQGKGLIDTRQGTRRAGRPGRGSSTNCIWTFEI